uniref:Uncharacterized protein n=1 Tax=Sphaerodactylus townsendi TaxID=933632 RepID=A0ACB8EE67_9SAUR
MLCLSITQAMGCVNTIFALASAPSPVHALVLCLFLSVCLPASLSHFGSSYTRSKGFPRQAIYWEWKCNRFAAALNVPPSNVCLQFMEKARLSAQASPQASGLGFGKDPSPLCTNTSSERCLMLPPPFLFSDLLPRFEGVLGVISSYKTMQ